MNKLTKGAIAGAAGIALLLGGAGSFALWNATSDISGGTITAGTLTLAPATGDNGSWYNVTTDPTKSSALDMSTFLIVPGDKLEFDQALDVVATGDDMKATLGFSSPACATLTGVTCTLVVKDASNATVANGDEVTVDTAGTATLNVSLTVDYPAGTTPGANNADKGKSLSFAATKITLDQVAP